MKANPLLGLSLSGLFAVAAVSAVEPAPDFTLPRLGTNTVVRLSGYSGRILVLDFFAYWCPPCGDSSSAIHREIAEHYSARKGNPAGVPVEVLAVNVEADHPKETAAFVRKHRLEAVAEDRSGKTFDATRAAICRSSWSSTEPGATRPRQGSQRPDSSMALRRSPS